MPGACAARPLLAGDAPGGIFGFSMMFGGCATSSSAFRDDVFVDTRCDVRVLPNRKEKTMEQTQIKTSELGTTGLEITPRRLRRLGARRRSLRLGLGRAGRRRFDRCDPPRARARRQLDRHGCAVRLRALGGGRRPRARRPRRAPVRVHERRAARRAGSNDGAEPQARLAQARARGEPLAARGGSDRPLPDPLADPRRGDRRGLVDSRRAEGGRARAPHRRLEFRRGAATAGPVDRARGDPPTALLARRARGRGRRSSPLRSARGSA